MSFEDHSLDFQKALDDNKHFRAKPYAGSHPATSYGNRRIAKSVSLRPDVVQTVLKDSASQDISFSNLIEQILIKHYDQKNGSQRKE